MTHPSRWRAGAAASVLAAAVAVLLIPGPQPAAAEPEKLPPGLNLVPPDAAFFAHADVAALLSSKAGQSARSAKAKEIEKFLAEAESKTGITPEMVKTALVFFPHLKDGADFQSPVFYVTFTKPYDKDRIVAGLKETAKDDKAEVVEAQPGVFEVREKADKKDEKKDKPKAKNVGDDPQVTIVMKDPTAIAVALGGSRKYLKPAATVDGPQTPALKAAAGGATATIGINFLEFPDEIRGDNIPAEVRAFQPLFQSDAAVATARLAGDKLNVEVRFRSAEKRKVIEAEKSLGAGQTLLQTALGFGIQQLEKAKDDTEKAILPLAKAVLEMVKAAKVSSNGTEAMVAATTTADLPVGPLLQTVFGGSTGPRGAAQRAQDQNNLKQIGLALHNYHDVYNGFPPTALVGKRGKPMLSWRVLILPYIEQDALYKEFKLDEPWDSEHNKKVLDKHPMPKVYTLPGVTEEGSKDTHYQVFVGNGAAFDLILPTKITSITDGTSNTVLVAPAAKAVPWTKPDDIAFDPKADPHKLILFRNGGASIGFADGSVRYISEKVTTDTLRAIITKAGGEVIGDLP